MKHKNSFLLILIAIVIKLSLTSLSAQTTDTTKKVEFKPSGKVWGYVFGDYFAKLHADSLSLGNTQYSGVPEKMNAFDFRRAYLGFDYNISEKFSTEILISYEGQTLSDNATRTFFLKSANLRWKNIVKNTDLVIGQMATPAFSLLSEKIWGYRSIEKTLPDMRRMSISNDVGVAIQGKLDSKGNFGYDLMVGNGSAQKIETDVYKKYYGDVYAKLLDQKIIIDLYADHEEVKDLPGYHRAKTSYKLFAAYTTEKITAGVEVFDQVQKNFVVEADSPTSVKPDTIDATAFGASVFLRGRIIKDKLNFFARYDVYNPDTKYNSDEFYFTGAAPVTETFITAGLDYTPNKNVHIMPNIWYNDYVNRTKNATGKSKEDNDLVARITFYYIFK